MFDLINEATWQTGRALRWSVFQRKPAPDLIRGGSRFASRKRVKTKIQSPVPIQSERKRLWLRTETASAQPPGGCHGYQFSADVPCLRSIFRSLVRYDCGLLVRGTAAGSQRPSLVKARYSVFERSGYRFA
jgi:hypothetical protein